MPHHLNKTYVPSETLYRAEETKDGLNQNGKDRVMKSWLKGGRRPERCSVGKAPATKSGDLNLIPGINMVKRELTPASFSDLHPCTHSMDICAHTCKQINVKRYNLFLKIFLNIRTTLFHQMYYQSVPQPQIFLMWKMANDNCIPLIIKFIKTLCLKTKVCIHVHIC